MELQERCGGLMFSTWSPETVGAVEKDQDQRCQKGPGEHPKAHSERGRFVPIGDLVATRFEPNAAEQTVHSLNFALVPIYEDSPAGVVEVRQDQKTRRVALGCNGDFLCGVVGNFGDICF